MYMIEDEITKDTKNILSCNVVCVEKDGEYPVEIAIQYTTKI